jgi:hypothetical protein
MNVLIIHHFIQPDGYILNSLKKNEEEKKDMKMRKVKQNNSAKNKRTETKLPMKSLEKVPN